MPAPLFPTLLSAIAFKPCAKETPGAYALRNTRGGAQISGTAFLKNYQIPFAGQTRAYPAVWNSEQSMLIISL